MLIIWKVFFGWVRNTKNVKHKQPFNKIQLSAFVETLAIVKFLFYE